MTTIGMILLVIVLLYYVVSMTMNFLGINIEFYGSYLLWFIALILFWGFLPGEEKFFSEKS